MKDRVIANGENWGRILADPALNTLAKKINRRFPSLGEQDIEWLIMQFEKTSSLKEEENGRALYVYHRATSTTKP